MLKFNYQNFFKQGIIVGISLLTITSCGWFTTASIENVSGQGPHYVAVGDNGIIKLSDADATFWTSDKGSAANVYNAVDYINGKLVAVGIDGKMAYSTDGINWQNIASPSKAWLYDINFGNNKYLVAGMNGTVMYSNDLNNWQKTLVAGKDWLNSICYGLIGILKVQVQHNGLARFVI
jgi:photosystem II stability/assembly factor-like uncharacterized protein